MLVTGKQILDKAHKENYAVGAFNINNMEILQGILDACEEKKSPVIIQASEGAIKYAGIEYLTNMVFAATKNSDIPVCLHLDHGTTYETIIQCIRHGFTSVMIDASHYDLKENIEKTREIVKIAHAAGVSVEAEIGRLSGIEDQISVDDRDAIYTNPKEAKIFVEETGVDSLAIAIGTAHGKYKGKPILDFDRLHTIKQLLNIPIVLHGASGLTEEDIKKAISLGVNKINIDTDIRIAFTDEIRKILNEKPEEFDPRKILKPARKAISNVVATKIDMFSSSNKI